MTEPSYRLIAPQANRSFVFKWEPFDLTTRWHYHPEIELIYFITGKTTCVIGDGFQHFEEGDLVILGANFPHVLQENREFARISPDFRPFGLIIQFTEEFLGKDFFQKPELNAVKQLLKKASRGLQFKNSAVEKISRTLSEMHQMPESRKLLSLLDALMTLSETDDFSFLTSKDYAYDYTQDEDRMHTVNQYVYEHFAGKITIADVAEVANMTETSFCRYFKTRTLKSFTQYLNEIRIAYACRLLSDVHYSVTQVCFEAGFNNLSYFTRQFKKVMDLSPRQYQKWKRTIVVKQAG